MKEVMQTLLNAGTISVMCIIFNYVFKYIVILLIIRHPELSEDKVKYITQMVSKYPKIQR